MSTGSREAARGSVLFRTPRSSSSRLAPRALPSSAVPPDPSALGAGMHRRQAGRPAAALAFTSVPLDTGTERSVCKGCV